MWFPFKWITVINHREVLENADPQSSMKQEWSKSYDKFDIIFGLIFRPHTENGLTSAGSSTGLEPMQPTTDAIFKRVDQLRVLVIGNGGVGKLSLIDECFGITNGLSDESAPISNTNTYFTTSQNKRLVLHESQSFGSSQSELNFQTVIDFLKVHKEKRNVRDQIHAVWLCLETPLDGSERFKAGVKLFFRMKAIGRFGSVPVMTVFTKYDRLVNEVRYGTKGNFYNPTETLDAKEVEVRDTLLAEEVGAKFQDLCVRPFEEVVGTCVPHIAVSTKEEYNGSRKSLNELIQLTAKYVNECLAGQVAEDVAVLLAVAQRVSPAVKIDAVIAAGKKRYWRGLASSVNFSGKTIAACIQVLHTDIVQVWDIQDGNGYLESKEFKLLMIALVGDQYNELSDPNTTTARASPMLTALYTLIGGLSKPAAPTVLPNAATLVVEKWVHNEYQQSALVLQRLMAYIVDFTIIMQVIFGLVMNARLRLSRRLIKLALTTYSKSEERSKVHNEVKDHVKQAGHTDQDAELDKIIQLIKDYQLKSDGMDQLQRTMEGFRNNVDEPWGVPEAQ